MTKRIELKTLIKNPSVQSKVSNRHMTILNGNCTESGKKNILERKYKDEVSKYDPELSELISITFELIKSHRSENKIMEIDKICDDISNILYVNIKKNKRFHCICDYSEFINSRMIEKFIFNKEKFNDDKDEWVDKVYHFYKKTIRKSKCKTYVAIALFNIGYETFNTKSINIAIECLKKIKHLSKRSYFIKALAKCLEGELAYSIDKFKEAYYHYLFAFNLLKNVEEECKKDKYMYEFKIFLNYNMTYLLTMIKNQSIDIGEDIDIKIIDSINTQLKYNNEFMTLFHIEKYQKVNYLERNINLLSELRTHFINNKYFNKGLNIYVDITKLYEELLPLTSKLFHNNDERIKNLLQNMSETAELFYKNGEIDIANYLYFDTLKKGIKYFEQRPEEFKAVLEDILHHFIEFIAYIIYTRNYKFEDYFNLDFKNYLEQINLTKPCYKLYLNITKRLLTIVSSFSLHQKLIQTTTFTDYYHRAVDKYVDLSLHFEEDMNEEIS